MKPLNRIRSRLSTAIPFERLARTRWADQTPTFPDARPAIIDSALARSQRRPSGNWYAFAASDRVRQRPVKVFVGGHELVAWRGVADALHVGPAACPHLGADLSTARNECGALVCSWHGLRLDGAPRYGWDPYPAHDDGILCWVRLDHFGGEEPTDRPVLSARPDGVRLCAVAHLEGTCEPSDIVANRLDPWHGAWFHPYSFTRLEVLSAPPVDAQDDQDRFLVAVTFRVGRLGIPVVAEFTSPEPRTVVMRIVEGEGVGSVVETHATPAGSDATGRPRTALLEAVVAHSDRPGFAQAVRAGAVITSLMRRAASRLWADDLEYAERRYWLRSRS